MERAFGDVGERVTLWDAVTGRQIQHLGGHSTQVGGVVFRPHYDESETNSTRNVRDSATDREVLTLRGHSGRVYDVAFSHDGRIAVAVGDGTVTVWDAIAGQEVLSLRGHSGIRHQVTFGPDGRSLASASEDGTVSVWDARPLSLELRIAREAQSVVEFHIAKSLPTAEMLARVHRDRTISEPVRQLALTLAEQYRRYLVVREAERVVDETFAKLVSRSEVLESLRADSALAEPVRREALALAEEVDEDPRKLNSAGWNVVRSPGGEPAAYDRAVRQAEAACKAYPWDGSYLNTLGVAQYRVGKYREAVETLTQSDRLNAVAYNGSVPSDLAFLALVQHRLGRTDQARATLQRLRRLMNAPVGARNEESQAFLREAEAIELDLVFPADPFAH